LVFYHPHYSVSVSVSLTLPRAFASETILPVKTVRLTDCSGIDLPERWWRVTSFLILVLRWI